MSVRAPRPRPFDSSTPSTDDLPLATDPTPLIEHAIARRPAWAVRAVIRTGRGPMRHVAVAELVGSLPAGLAATADEAIAEYRKRNPLAPAQGEYRAFVVGRP